MTFPSAAPPDRPPDRWSDALRAIAGLSLAGRFLLPTEATLLGQTPGAAAADGWLSVLALLALTVWAARAWRTGGALRWGRCEWLLGGLVLAHALAAIPVFVEGGERRAAAETVVNWAGLAAAGALLRQLRRPGDGRWFAALAIACGTAAAAIGAWQVTVSLPATRAAYLDLRAREEALPDLPPGLAARQERAAVRDALARNQVPADPAARQRWEDRLLGSREPFGPYSLANTLAGVLLAAALLCLPWANRASRPAAVTAGLAAALTLGMLLLTKSRTGYVGFAAGLLVWAALRFAERGNPNGAGRGRGKQIVLASAFATVSLIAAVVAAVATGQLDREVLSEAPRSLTFRLQYWTGTLRALAERPLLGTGPANLRPFYLMHKDAAASESIAAPHNLVLDLWTSGGLLAPLLAAALAWCGVRRWRRGSQEPAADAAEPHEDEPSRRWDPLHSGALTAFGLIGAVGGLLGPVPDLDPALNPWIYAVVRGWSWPVLLSALPAAAVLWGFGRGGRANGPTGAAWAAASVGLGVHLLGADGAEFPAVLALFLLALAAAPPAAAEIADRPAGRATFVLVIVSAVCTAVALFGVLLPGRTAGALLEEATVTAARGRDPRPLLRRAEAADPLSDAATVALAEFLTARSFADPGDTRARRAAVAAWNDLLERRPRSGQAFARLSDLHRAAAKWDEAVAADRAGARLDPSAAAPHARLAESAAAAGDLATARAAAAAALERDRVTRAAGHADRVLPDETVAALRGLLDSAG